MAKAMSLRIDPQPLQPTFPLRSVLKDTAPFCNYANNSGALFLHVDPDS